MKSLTPEIEVDFWHGTAAIFLAAKGDHVEVVQYLLGKGIGPSGITILVCAIENNQGEDVIDTLLKAGVMSLPGDLPLGQSPLHSAVKAKQTRTVQALLKAGADSNLRDGSGATALALAARLDNREIVEVLLGAGADINIPTHKGSTPLLEAYKNGHWGSLAVLIQDDRADWKTFISKSYPPILIVAALQNRPTWVVFLLSKGAEVDKSCLAVRQGVSKTALYM